MPWSQKLDDFAFFWRTLLKSFLRTHLLCGVLLLASASTIAPGCASTNANASYSSQAQALYKDAQETLEDGEFSEAIRRFNLIRTRYSYSKYAALSDLRIADAYFIQEKYATAIEQYRTFNKLYVGHPQNTYANWRVALSFFRQMPTDNIILPPGYERDLARARDAEREMRLFLKRNPNTEYTKDAGRYLLLARRRLADHELYVATFYLTRNNPRAAALRLTYLLKNYTGLGLDPQALFLLARAYLELKDVDKAVVALKDLVSVHPQSEYAQRARAYAQRYQLNL